MKKEKRQQIAWSCAVEGMFWVKKGEERGRQGKVQREGSTGEGAKVGGRKEGRKKGVKVGKGIEGNRKKAEECAATVVGKRKGKTDGGRQAMIQPGVRSGRPYSTSYYLICTGPD